MPAFPEDTGAGRRLDLMGEASFPASDPPAAWTWECDRGAEPAIQALVAELQRAQQAEDVDAFLALFAADPVWTTAHGRRLEGLRAIAAFTQQVLPGAMSE